VCRNSGPTLQASLQSLAATLQHLAAEYEIVVVDNASRDDTVATLQRLTAVGGISNLQVLALAREVDRDTAAWVGLDSALGDFVLSFDLAVDADNAVQPMLEAALDGSDLVFAENRRAPRPPLVYRTLERVFDEIYYRTNGFPPSAHPAALRLLNRAAVHFLSQHAAPSLAYRHLPTLAGFQTTSLQLDLPNKKPRERNLFESIDRGIGMLVSTTRAPMRLVTLLSTLGAGLNVLYTVYVVAVYLLKADVTPGWTTLSLQQSGMFFLLSLMILVLGEYILHMASLSNEGPRWHIAREFSSAEFSRKRVLNVEESPAASPEPAGPRSPR
jgi:hypothetical protein